MTAILRDSVVAAVPTHSRAIPLAMIIKRKSIHGFPFLSYMSMVLRLAALRANRAPLLFDACLLPSMQAQWVVDTTLTLAVALTTSVSPTIPFMTSSRVGGRVQQECTVLNTKHHSRASPQAVFISMTHRVLCATSDHVGPK